MTQYINEEGVLVSSEFDTHKRSELENDLWDVRMIVEGVRE